jgi:hypothetical protein
MNILDYQLNNVICRILVFRQIHMILYELFIFTWATCRNINIKKSFFKWHYKLRLCLLFFT